MFILALDSVYSVLQESNDIRGVLIKSGDKSTEIKVSGYVDDTVVYLRDHSLIKHVLSILNDFAGVSGLTTNMSKSVVLRLHSRGLDLPLETRASKLTPLPIQTIN